MGNSSTESCWGGTEWFSSYCQSFKSGKKYIQGIDCNIFKKNKNKKKTKRLHIHVLYLYSYFLSHVSVWSIKFKSTSFDKLLL